MFGGKSMMNMDDGGMKKVGSARQI